MRRAAERCRRRHGPQRKKAIVVIRMATTNRSQTSVPELKHMIHNLRC